MKSRNLLSGVVALVLFVLLLPPPSVPAADSHPADSLHLADAESRERPTVALVLSGGAALGFAHTGVLKVLEEVGMPIDMVVGTSMGAIIGGFYAAGYSPQDIGTIAAEIDWPVMFTDSIARHYYLYRARTVSERYFLEAGFDRDGIHLGGGLIAGQNITSFFERLTLKVPDNTDFDALAVPFRAVAADVISGEEVVFASGSLSDAMRASMTIPGLLAPYRVGDRFLVDGGVVNNLPVDVAREMGADIVIAVEVGEPLPTAVAQLSRSPFASIDQSTKILVEANMRPQRELADLLITPDLSPFTRAGFSDAPGIMERGEEAARGVLPELQQLVDRIAAERELPRRAPAPGSYATELAYPHISRLRIEGGTEVERELALHRFRRLLGTELTPDALVRPVEETYALGRFDLVKTQIIAQDGRETDAAGGAGPGAAGSAGGADDAAGHTLLVTLVPRIVSRNTFRVGLRYAGMISSSAHSKMILTQNLTVNDITGRGSYWSTDVALVNTFGLATSYFQPLGANFYLEPHLSFIVDSDSFAEVGKVGTVVQYQELIAGANLGLLLSRYGELRIGYRYSLFRSHLTDIEEEQEWAGVSSLVAAVGVDSRDSRLFPRRGTAAEVEYQAALPLADDDLRFQRLEWRGETHLPFGRRASIGALVAGGTDFTDRFDEERSLRRFQSFEQADDRIFIGYRNDPFRGRHRLALGGELRFHLGPAPGSLTAHPVLAFDGGVVDAWNRYPSDMDEITLNWTASAGLGVRFSDAFGALLRVGMVRELQPFVALNLGAFGL